ncbi:putative oxidoreductase,short chain dehydrogenase [Camillea tinctor]|nr:putative oxidoreductase,short chain dehydrogenase [Camillea tinctor]
MAAGLIVFTVFGGVGFITILFSLVKILNLICIYLRPSRLSRYAHLSRAGEAPWALVTGASDGIGLAFAYELAGSGFNVVLHGRNHEKISRVMSRLQATFPQRSYRILVADAGYVACLTHLKASTQEHRNGQEKASSAPLNFTAIQRELGDINLTVLINNAGGGPVNPAFLSVLESPEDTITESISLNGLFPLYLTRALLPNLIRHAPSLVINTNTMIDQGFPLVASYSASKEFIMAITRALRLEMQMVGLGEDVEILGIKFGRVTGAHGCKEPVSLFVPNATMMVKAALARAGYGNRIVIGYWGHALQQLGARLFIALPRWVEDKIFITIMCQQRKNIDGSLKDVKST